MSDDAQQQSSSVNIAPVLVALLPLTQLLMSGIALPEALAMLTLENWASIAAAVIAADPDVQRYLSSLEVWLFELVVRAVTKVDPAKIAADMQQWAQQNAIAAIAHDPGIISER